jgi:hypothetical protein
MRYVSAAIAVAVDFVGAGFAVKPRPLFGPAVVFAVASLPITHL